MDGEDDRASESRLASLPARATVAGFLHEGTGVGSCRRVGKAPDGKVL